MENEFITLSNFSKRVGISEEKVKERLLSKEQYKPLYKNYRGLYLISKSALVIFAEDDSKEKYTEPIEEIIETERAEEQTAVAEIERLLRENEELKASIEAKDKQIIELSTRYADLAEKSLALTEQAQRITAQAQILHLQEQNKSKEEESLSAEMPIEERKPSLLERLFKKK
jgi:predicted RNase H-like nuclease (RuvC/YqgF family)